MKHLNRWSLLRVVGAVALVASSAVACLAQPEKGHSIVNTVDVLDSFISYTDIGSGDTPVVFLHGNPTSSYLWRNVIPHLSDKTRVLAPDLIGMGASGKPDSPYRFADHARYLDAWFDALDLDQVIIVGHDWGGALGMDWAARHPGRVRGIAVIETFLRPGKASESTPQARELFAKYRSAEGERMVLEENMFIEFNLPAQVTNLSPEDHDVYRAPYPTPASRKPLLAWPREIPLDGEPADVVAIIENYGRYLATTPEIPKLIMALEKRAGRRRGGSRVGRDYFRERGEGLDPARQASCAGGSPA